MLIEFSVENFLSIKNRMTLSMLASKDSSHEDNLIHYKDNKKDLRALKTAVIYGANASGKTNILKAIGFMSKLLRISHEMQQGRKIRRIPFKLDRSYIDKPSSFDIIFKHEDIKYAYGFSVDEEKVHEEYLYYYPNGRQSLIFERENTVDYRFTIDVELQTQIKDKFDSKNKLYLSTASLWEYEKAKKPFEWLNKNLKIAIDHSDLEAFTVDYTQKNEDANLLVRKYLKFADLGIDNMNISEKEVPDEVLNSLLGMLKDENKSELLEEIRSIEINTIHTGIDEEGKLIDIPFDFTEESDGTQKFFGLLGPWLDVLKKGYVLVVDELDIRLHTLLTKKLITLFHNPEINKKNAQLIFTTHDTNLLDQDLFRRDQIWFTEKREDKSTELYSLDDFSVRKDAKIEKGYLQGKYGAIPYIKGDWSWD